MTKLLSARDLLEVIRHGETPEAENMEVIVGPTTLGRRVYNGTTPRRAQRPIAQHPQVPRRRDTVKIETPLTRAQAQALKHGTSAGRGVDERPAVKERPSSPPAYGSLGADEPTPAPWDLGAEPPAIVPAPGRPVASQSAPPSASRAETPALAKPAKLVPPPLVVPTEDGKGGVPGRKVGKTGWGRPGEPAPTSKPVTLAAVARLPAQPGDVPAPPPPPPPPVGPAGPLAPGGLVINPTGVSLPVPGVDAPAPVVPAAVAAPAASGVASMFSWVTQRADWAPAAESLSAPPVLSTPPPPPPPAPAPPAPEEPRSLQSDERIALSGEETVVLLNYDPTLDLESLAERTGLTEFRVSHVVSNLRKRGVIDEDEPSARADHATLVDMPMAPVSARSPESNRSRTDEIDTNPTLLEMDLSELARVQQGVEGSDDATYVDEGLPALFNGHDPRTELARTFEPRSTESRGPESGRDVPPISSRPPPPSESGAADTTDAEPPDEVPAEEKEATQNYLAHYEKVLAALPVDERTKVAQTSASTVDLHALAYDKDPDVIRALWDNVNITHDHARFAAFHHRTAGGLEVMVQRAEFFKDQNVQRRILRNPMISEQLLRRLLVPRRLIDIYKTSLDRESAERTRSSARNMLRNKFATTDSDDRMELIWKTEGRALAALSGLSIDSKTAALICSRQIMSVALVQNFTRFAATPPSVITHFLKQPLVKRQIHLRNALLKHPNCPSDAKRAF